MEFEMTPQQKIKHLILLKSVDFGEDAFEFATPADIDRIYDEREGDNWGLQDARNEVREGEFETELKCESSRNYESKAVAAKYLDGSYVGWTYWYGGGKHSDPESIDWMDDAYDVACVEEQKLVVVRTFTRPGEQP